MPSWNCQARGIEENLSAQSPINWAAQGSWVKPGCWQNLRGELVTDGVPRTHSEYSPWARSWNAVLFCILKCYFHHYCCWIQHEGVYPAVLCWLLLHFSLYLNNSAIRSFVMSSFCLRLACCRALLVLLLTFAVSFHCRLKWSDLSTHNLRWSLISDHKV